MKIMDLNVKSRHRGRCISPGVAVILFAAAAGWNALAWAGADRSTGPDEIERSRGSGESYWGDVPSRTDSVSALFESEKKPAWERAVDTPWQVVTFPVDLAVDGVGAVLIRADESRFYGRFVEPVLFPSFGPVEGRFGVTVDGIAGAGLGFTGEAADWLGSGSLVRLGLRATREENNKATLGFLFPRSGGDQVQIGGGFRKVPNARYFGTGPRSGEGAESYFSLETGWVGFGYEHSLSGGLTLGGGALYTMVGAYYSDEGEEEEHTHLKDRFAGNFPHGYGERSDGVMLDISLVHDDTAENGRPERGGRRRLAAFLFRAGDGSKADHRSFRVEAEQYLSLWFTRRTLALRGVTTWIDGTGDGPLPFQRLHTNDSPDLFRGYNDMRWRDRGLFSITAEYRWPVWNRTTVDGTGVDGFLFADAGQVFGEFGEITREHLRRSWGGGVRLIGKGGFSGRIEYARSEEESVFRIVGDQIFQWSKGGLAYGKNPVPSR